jgi:membrane protein DedA with SNARE-associated domain/rhodanese-related sulfurtransferase
LNETLHFVAKHGYWLLIAAVLGRQACLPVPTNLLLVAAGALARQGSLSLAGVMGVSVLTFLLADLAWFAAGRSTGDRILHFVCGLSSGPESCVCKARTTFGSHGVRTLLFSKFVIGLDALAAPLTGAARTAPARFLVFDGAGAALWSGAYTALGYIFSNQLDRVAVHMARIGFATTAVIAAIFIFNLVRRFARWERFVREFKLARITPEELTAKLNRGDDILIIDLQGRGDHSAGVMAIPGAVRIDPHRLEQYGHAEVSPSREVVLYCAVPGDFTSARVALALRRRGVEHVRPLAGGLQAWRDRGLPVTADVRVAIPFDEHAANARA